MFDMNQCKPGDKLVTMTGEICEYIGRRKKDVVYPHYIKDMFGKIVTRTSFGQTFFWSKSPKDIVGCLDNKF